MNIEIANRLLELRKQHGFSQEELAARLGISRQAVSKWERAEASPDTDNLILLANLYHISLDQLLLSEINSQRTEEAPRVSLEKESPFGEKAPEYPPVPETEYPNSYSAGYQREAPEYASYPGQGNVQYQTGFQGAVAEAKRPFPWWGFMLCIIGAVLLAFTLLKIFAPGAYPIICTIAFLIMGFKFNKWHPGWMIYLTIPLFYIFF